MCRVRYGRFDTQRANSHLSPEGSFVHALTFRGGLSGMICHMANMLKSNLRQIFILQKKYCGNIEP